MSNKPFLRAISHLAGLAMSMMLALPCSARLVDSFDATSDGGIQAVTAGAGGSDTNTQGPLPGVVGAVRSLAVPGTSPVSGPSVVSGQVSPGMPGSLSFSQGTQTLGSLLLTWDSGGDGLGGPAGVDLTDLGDSNAFFAVLLEGGSGIDGRLDVMDTAGRTATFTGPLAEPGLLALPFTDLLAAPGSDPDTDLRAVSSITLELSGVTPGAAVTLGGFFTDTRLPPPRPVPLPSMPWLLMGALAAAALAARRGWGRL